MLQIFSATMTRVHDPLFLPIEFEVDVEARTGRISVPGQVEAGAEPILNPVTGKPHRARIDLPYGFEYSLAEIGSGTTRTGGEIELDLQATYAQFADIHLTNAGVVR